MAKQSLRQILAANVARAMEQTPGLDTQPALAARAQVSQSQVSRLLRSENGVGLDILEAVAGALGYEAWELLMDEEETRRRAIERVLSRTPVPDSKVERHLPSAPSKVLAMRRRKKA